VRASTRLTPVTDWLAAAHANPARRAETSAILLALLIAVLPATLVDAAIRFGLRRPAALCAQWALPRQEEFLPSPEADTLAEPPAVEDVPTRRFVSLRAWLRRLAFALLKFLLAMLPLAGFIITAQVFMSGFITTRAAMLAATGTANAYLVCRAVQELARLLVSPAAPPLRLITMPSPRAQALMKFLLIVLATGFFAFSLISCALILDLPHAGAQVLILITALVLHLEAAWGIWRSRRLVGLWITGNPKATGLLAWLRQRLGKWWYLFALFYVLALWVAWAGGVQNAFAVLLRAVLVLIAAVVAGRLAWSGSALLLERVFPDPATAAKRRYPALLARARAYNPLIRFVIRAAIGAGVLLFVLQGWGVDALGWLHANTISRALLSALSSIVLTTGLALCLWEVINFVLHTRLESLTATGRKRQATRLRTLAPILRAALGTVIFLVALVVCLSQIGVNTTGLLAVSSIAGIAVGFGSQKLVQDIITGLFMLMEDAIQVGDVVTLAGMSGTVERLSIRTIRLRGGDGSINIIPFSAVTTVTNQTRDFSNAEFTLTVSYAENIDHVSAVLTDIGRNMRAEPAWSAMIRDDLQIYGLDKFGEQGMVITGVIRTGPGQNAAVRREFYRRVQQRFTTDGIIIPFGRPNLFQMEPLPQAAKQLPAAETE